MTILKNKRRTSRIEYERTFLSLYEYMTGLIDNFPRRYMEPLGKPMKMMLNEIYDDVTKISDMYVEKEENKARYLACRKAVDGLTLHPKKTCVVKLTKGFTFLKVRYHASGEKTIKTLAKSGIVRMRRKLKKFRGMIGRTKLTADDVYASIQSWITHARVASSYHAVKSMLTLYDEMYDGYRLTRRYWKNNVDLHRKRKVVRI